ncbi:MAG TPA: nucleotidyltransferase [Gammaproteobacteria bacterium]|nr:nucleotidyltransferase [Gammaproteobacteria bacterium]
MNVLIPMAGAGQRFVDAGYEQHKPAILTTDRRTGKKVPMVVAATYDLPDILSAETQLIYVDRLFHREDGVENAIYAHFPKARFITIKDLTEGQASTCLLAKEYINNNTPLLIAGCDNGMVFDEGAFVKAKTEADALIFTYRQHEAVLVKPEAYGWVSVDDQNNALAMSVKQAISQQPLEDHAVVATFWFKRGSDFVRAAEAMIAADDRIHGEFYVDQVMQHAIDAGLKIKVFEIQRYIGWGTPLDFENYEKTISYWQKFIEIEGLI